ncbi:MAG: hypothetical protein P9M13_01095 [Candidatus Ancaeobacter aquaticus]|nr:hypothetical protein [Candidatus Ancaeobacter aquaticus]
MYNTKRYNVYLKCINLCIAGVFLYTSVFVGVPRQSFAITPKIPLTDIASSIDLNKVVIPENFGSITEKYISKDTSNAHKTIIVLQDSHANLEAQKNISTILSSFISPFSPQMVFVEGAKGILDAGFIRSISDTVKRTMISDYLLKIGYLTGSEYYASTARKQPAALYGVENRELYYRDLNAFQNATAKKQTNEEILNPIKNAFSIIRQKICKGSLNELYRKEEAYIKGDMKFTEFCKYISQKALEMNVNIDSYVNIMIVLQSIALEEMLSIEKVDGEREAFINVLSKRLVKEELADIVKKSLLFRTGRMLSSDYYNYLIQLGKENALFPSEELKAKSKYLNLLLYARVIEMQSHIDAQKLYEEAEKFTEVIKENLIKTPQQAQFDRLWNNVLLSEKLVTLKMTRSEAQKIMKDPGICDLKNAISFIMNNGRGIVSESMLGNIREDRGLDIAFALDFYSIAIKRDSVIFDNMIREFKRNVLRTAVVVTGGFHKDGIIEKIKNAGYSYLVVTPRMTEKYDDSLYQNIMSSKETVLDRFLDRVGTRLAPELRMSPQMNHQNYLKLKSYVYFLNFLLKTLDEERVTVEIDGYTCTLVKKKNEIDSFDVRETEDYGNSVTRISGLKEPLQTVLTEGILLRIKEEDIIIPDEKQPPLTESWDSSLADLVGFRMSPIDMETANKEWVSKYIMALPPSNIDKVPENIIPMTPLHLDKFDEQFTRELLDTYYKYLRHLNSELDETSEKLYKDIEKTERHIYHIYAGMLSQEKIDQKEAEKEKLEVEWFKIEEERSRINDVLNDKTIILKMIYGGHLADFHTDDEHAVISIHKKLYELYGKTDRKNLEGFREILFFTLRHEFHHYLNPEDSEIAVDIADINYFLTLDKPRQKMLTDFLSGKDIKAEGFVAILKKAQKSGKVTDAIYSDLNDYMLETIAQRITRNLSPDLDTINPLIKKLKELDLKSVLIQLGGEFGVDRLIQLFETNPQYLFSLLYLKSYQERGPPVVEQKTAVPGTKAIDDPYINSFVTECFSENLIQDERIKEILSADNSKAKWDLDSVKNLILIANDPFISIPSDIMESHGVGMILDFFFDFKDIENIGRVVREIPNIDEYHITNIHIKEVMNQKGKCKGELQGLVNELYHVYHLKSVGETIVKVSTSLPIPGDVKGREYTEIDAVTDDTLIEAKSRRGVITQKEIEKIIVDKILKMARAVSQGNYSELANKALLFTFNKGALRGVNVEKLKNNVSTTLQKILKIDVLEKNGWEIEIKGIPPGLFITEPSAHRIENNRLIARRIENIAQKAQTDYRNKFAAMISKYYGIDPVVAKEKAEEYKYDFNKISMWNNSQSRNKKLTKEKFAKLQKSYPLHLVWDDAPKPDLRKNPEKRFAADIAASGMSFTDITSRLTSLKKIINAFLENSSVPDMKWEFIYDKYVDKDTDIVERAGQNILQINLYEYLNKIDVVRGAHLVDMPLAQSILLNELTLAFRDKELKVNDMKPAYEIIKKHMVDNAQAYLFFLPHISVEEISYITFLANQLTLGDVKEFILLKENMKRMVQSKIEQLGDRYKVLQDGRFKDYKEAVWKRMNTYRESIKNASETMGEIAERIPFKKWDIDYIEFLKIAGMYDESTLPQESTALDEISNNLYVAHLDSVFINDPRIKKLKQLEQDIIYTPIDIVDTPIKEAVAVAAFPARLNESLDREYSSNTYVARGKEYTLETISGLRDMIKSETAEPTPIHFEDVIFSLNIDKRLNEIVPEGVDILGIITDVFEDYKNLYPDWRDRLKNLSGKNISIALLDKSPNVFEDHIGDGFIGINKAVFDVFGKKENILRTVLGVGIFHELRHESEMKGLEIEEAVSEESVQLSLRLLSKEKIDIKDYLIDLQGLYSVESVFFGAFVEKTKVFDLSKNIFIGNERLYNLYIKYAGRDTVFISDCHLYDDSGENNKAILKIFNKSIITADHHYADPDLRRETATSQMIEFLEKNTDPSTGKIPFDDYKSLSYITSHVDPDSMLAYYVLKNWNEIKNNDVLLTLINETAYYTDFGLLVKDVLSAEFINKMKLFANILFGMQKDIYKQGPAKENAFEIYADKIPDLLKKISVQGLKIDNPNVLPLGLSDYEEMSKNRFKELVDTAEMVDKAINEGKVIYDEKSGIVTVEFPDEGPMIYNPNVIAYLKERKYFVSKKEPIAIISARAPPAGAKGTNKYVISLFYKEDYREMPSIINVPQKLNSIDTIKGWGGRDDGGGSDRRQGSTLSIDVVKNTLEYYLQKDYLAPDNYPSIARMLYEPLMSYITEFEREEALKNIPKEGNKRMVSEELAPIMLDGLLAMNNKILEEFISEAQPREYIANALRNRNKFISEYKMQKMRNQSVSVDDIYDDFLTETYGGKISDKHIDIYRNVIENRINTVDMETAAVLVPTVNEATSNAVALGLYGKDLNKLTDEQRATISSPEFLRYFVLLGESVERGSLVGFSKRNFYELKNNNLIAKPPAVIDVYIRMLDFYAGKGAGVVVYDSFKDNILLPAIPEIDNELNSLMINRKNNVISVVREKKETDIVKYIVESFNQKLKKSITPDNLSMVAHTYDYKYFRNWVGKLLSLLVFRTDGTMIDLSKDEIELLVNIDPRINELVKDGKLEIFPPVNYNSATFSQTMKAAQALDIAA